MIITQISAQMAMLNTNIMTAITPAITSTQQTTELHVAISPFPLTKKINVTSQLQQRTGTRIRGETMKLKFRIYRME